MLNFSAIEFYHIGRNLARVAGLLRWSKPDALPDAELQDIMSDGIKKVLNSCDKIGLRLSVDSATRLLAHIKAPEKHAKLKQEYDELHLRIHDEIKRELFLFVPSTDAGFYNADRLFGDSVHNAFSSSALEISEAGKCIALNRNTAAVCHLMRVLEVGLQALAVKLKVQYANKPWNYVIEVAELRLKRIRSAKRKPKNWKTDEKFYSEALAHFRFLKDAWRNYAMHVLERYDRESTESIFNHVKSFMRHLATKLKESP